jgi:hypothetical protein
MLLLSCLPWSVNLASHRLKLLQRSLKRQKFSLDSLQFVDCLPECLGWFISVRHDPTIYAHKALLVGPLPLTIGKRKPGPQRMPESACGLSWYLQLGIILE